MRQIHIRMTPAGGRQPLFGDVWRKLVSDHVRRAHGPAARAGQLFHHFEEEASERSARRGPHDKAGVCFVANPTWVGVVATGDESVALVREYMMDLVLAAGESLGACAIEHHELSLGVENRNGRVYSYRAPSFVTQRGSGHTDVGAVHAALVRGLNQWAEQHDVDVAFTSADVLVESVQVLAPAVSRSRGNPIQWGRNRVALTFSMPYFLRGYWFAGGLASKGYSQVHFRRPGNAAKAGAPE